MLSIESTVNPNAPGRPLLKRPTNLNLKCSFNADISFSPVPLPISNILKDSTNSNNTSTEPITIPTTTSTLNQYQPSTPKSIIANKKKKRRRHTSDNQEESRFSDTYSLSDEILGEGSYGRVCTCLNIYTGDEYAVKIIDKRAHPNRERFFKEIEIFLHCRECANILQIIEYFEEEERFYVVFEKMDGGPLLQHIERRGHLSEHEASIICRDIAIALNFLHSKGMAHRDLKPENILCARSDSLIPVKIGDFDLGATIRLQSRSATPVTTPELNTPVGSAEYLAPEVVEAFISDMSYDKRCDLWSLGVILYIMLSGSVPFTGQCGGECGWDTGRECFECQRLLFERIKDGYYEFPSPDWDHVSEDAKDLIKHLLVRDVTKRYSAADVLRHPWIVGQAPSTQLSTPNLLKRNNSLRDIGKYTDEAMAINRMVEHDICARFNRSFSIDDHADIDRGILLPGDDLTPTDDVEFEPSTLKPQSILMNEGLPFVGDGDRGDVDEEPETPRPVSMLSQMGASHSTAISIGGRKNIRGKLNRNRFSDLRSDEEDEDEHNAGDTQFMFDHLPSQDFE